jgi:hypothetical protein
MINDHFSPTLLRCCLGTVGLLLALTMPGTALRAEPNADALSLAYGIYIAGKSVYQISYDARLSSAGYASTIDIAPTGVGKLLSDYRLAMSTQGGVTGGRLEPAGFKLRSSKHREAKSLQMTWTDEQLPQARRSFELSPAGAAAVKKALVPAIPDPLTAVLRHSLENADKPCDRTERVYNGSEVYDLKITLLGETILDADRKSGYRGPAMKCRVVLVPVAGYSARKMRRYLKQPPTYAVWFATMLAPGLGKNILVPVAATGTAAGRNFTIAVSRATLAGKVIAAVQ